MDRISKRGHAGWDQRNRRKSYILLGRHPPILYCRHARRRQTDKLLLEERKKKQEKAKRVAKHTGRQRGLLRYQNQTRRNNSYYNFVFFWMAGERAGLSSFSACNTLLISLFLFSFVYSPPQCCLAFSPFFFSTTLLLLFHYFFFGCI